MKILKNEMEKIDEYDYIYQNKITKDFYFIDESNAEWVGPFESLIFAQGSLKRYIELLEQEDIPS